MTSVRPKRRTRKTDVQRKAPRQRTYPLRREVLDTPGVRLLRSRREHMDGWIYTVDLLRCSRADRRTCFLKVCWWRGDLNGHEAFFTLGEALAQWPFEVNMADLSGLAVPALIETRRQEQDKMVAIALRRKGALDHDSGAPAEKK